MTRLFAALAATFIAGAATAQDAAIGTWQTQADEGAFAHVQMAPCGNAVCGTIVRTYKTDGTAYQSPNVGLQIVRSMVPNGDGSYAGEVLRPADKKVYKGKMQVSGNQMSLAGCVLGGIICKSQTWVRVQ